MGHQARAVADGDEEWCARENVFWSKTFPAMFFLAACAFVVDVCVNEGARTTLAFVFIAMLYLCSFIIFGIANYPLPHRSSRIIPYPTFDPLEATRRGLDGLPIGLEATRLDADPVPDGEMERRLQNDADGWQRRYEWIR